MEGLPRWLSGKRIHLPRQEMWVPSLIRGDPLKKEMAIHSSILAWEIPWTEKPGRLQSMGLQSQTRLSMHAAGIRHLLSARHTECPGNTK